MAAYINDVDNRYSIDVDFLADFCNDINVPFRVKEVKIQSSKTNSNKSECFICSWNRRKALFNLTKELHCNKLALAHHMDDAIETLLINMVFHGSLSGLPEKIKFFKGRIEVIRPLLHIPAKDLEIYAQMRKLPKELKICQYGENTMRKEINNWIDHMEQFGKDDRKNMFRCVNNQYPDYLPTKHKGD